MITLADRSAGGWTTVQEYMPDELASNSDDSRKMRQAENRATKKRKSAFPRKPSSTFSSATQFQKSDTPIHRKAVSEYPSLKPKTRMEPFTTK